MPGQEGERSINKLIMSKNKRYFLWIETPGPNRRSPVLNLPCQWPSLGTDRVCSTWGRAEGLQGDEMQQQGSGFNYSHAVTVTSGHDAEINFFCCHEWPLQGAARQAIHKRSNKLLCRIWLKNILSKYCSKPVTIPPSATAEWVFRKRNCRNPWKLQATKRDSWMGKIFQSSLQAI